MKSSMGAKIDAYVDTSALIAFLDASDTHHPLFRRLMIDFPDQDLTVTDAVGLHEMRARGIASCWSTDHHLGLTGVPLVIHQY